MNTRPPSCTNGSGPNPANAVACPISLPAGHELDCACASEQSSTLESIAATPGGRCIPTPDSA